MPKPFCMKGCIGGFGADVDAWGIGFRTFGLQD